MPPDLYAKLISRIERAVKKRGAKARLARCMGVPRQRVTEWLTGAGAPTAAKTLELLAWVEAAEASQQKKRGGGADTPPPLRPKKENSYVKEKPSSGSP